MNISELNELRVIMLIETDPQSNKYRQVILNQNQSKKISDLTDSFFEEVKYLDLKDGYKVTNFELSEDLYDLSKIAPEIQTSYENDPQ